jgi:hypothetical protein
MKACRNLQCLSEDNEDVGLNELSKAFEQAPCMKNDRRKLN